MKLVTVTVLTAVCLAGFVNSQGQFDGKMLKSSVKINQGVLQGKIAVSKNGEFVSFKGVPYAKPPLGNLRFADPQPAESWGGIRDASEHGDICLQKYEFSNKAEGSEDCLYLNVYTPNIEGQEGKRYPVMLLIHGGGFKMGSGNAEMFGPEYLVDRKVVLVTINYRVEAFGFLSIDTEDVPGNAGLKDQAMAIKWVKENIYNFGGDPDNITIFGESAGSVSVTYHLFSPLTKGLFQAAIAQSGVCTVNWALDKDSVNRAFRLGKILGKDTADKNELLEFLRSVPSSDLVDVSMQTRNEIEIKNGYIITFFGPVIEKFNIPGKTFLSTPIKKLLKNGQFHDVPLIIGLTNGEGIVMANNAIEKSDEINKDFNTYVAGLTRKKICKNVETEVKKFYFGEHQFDEKTLENMVHLRTDTMFTYSIYEFVKQITSKIISPVYFYVFGCISEVNVLSKVYGGSHLNLTCHAEDVNYLFSSQFSDYPKSDKFLQMSNTLLALWTNFSKYRNPTPLLDEIIQTKWKPIARGKFNYLDITNELKLKLNPFQERMKFWENLRCHVK